MDNLVDSRMKTPIAHNAPYMEVGLQGYRVRALYDTGSNTTIVSSTLARQLGLRWEPYYGTFRQASGTRAQFIGKLGKVVVQFHDSLAVITQGIRVMEAEDKELQMILGMDIFN